MRKYPHRRSSTGGDSGRGHWTRRTAEWAWNNRHNIHAAGSAVYDSLKGGGLSSSNSNPYPSSRSSHHSHHSVSTVRPVARAVNPEKEGAPIYKNVPMVTGYKKIKQKKKLIPQISKGFRQKVTKVINDKQIHGHFHQYSGAQHMIQQYDTGYKTYWPAGGMGQIYGSTPAIATISAGNQSSWLFGPDFFLHCASVLFNGKGITGGSTANLNAGNLGISSTGNFLTYTNGALRLKCTVKSSHVTYRYKNLSKQAVRMEFLVCKPRRKSSYNPVQCNDLSTVSVVPVGYANLPNATTGFYDQTDASSLMDPLSYWSRAARLDNAQTLQTLHIYALPPTYNANVFASGRYTSLKSSIGLDPLIFPTFRSAYAFERIKVTLQPGQEYILKVEGPSDLELDSSHWFSGSIVQNIQMYSRSVVVSVLNEFAAVTAGGLDAGDAEHIATSPASSFTGVGVEMTVHCKMSMPEETTGLPEATIGALTNLVYRKPYYVYVEDVVGTAGTGGIVYNAENPTVPDPVP